MIAEFWSHYGVIPVSKIKEQTGASKVLVPVTKRAMVTGTDIIAMGTKLTNSDGELVQTFIEYIGPVWKFVWTANCDAMVIPKILLSKAKQKATQYSIVQLGTKHLWVENHTKLHKVGQSFTNNHFILLKKERKDAADNSQAEKASREAWL